MDENTKKIIECVNDTKKEYSEDVTIVELFQKQVKRNPDFVSVIYDDKKITYSELDRKSNSVAWFLKDKGIQANDLVAIITDRSIEMVVCILGILKSGAAYMPIAKSNPSKRTEFSLQESNCKAVICEEETKSKLNCSAAYINIQEKEVYTYNADSLEEFPSGNDLAYVIYTSGSTGNPKGVMIEHKALANRLLWMQDRYPISQEDTLIQKTPFTFDVSVWEMFWWAIAGAKLYIMEPNMEKFPQAIIVGIAKNKVTIMHFVPSMMDVFLKYAEGMDVHEKLGSLRRVFCSGEKLTSNQVNKFNKILFEKNGTRLTNLYGPTEATIDVTYYDCPTKDEPDVIPIGKPIYNTRILILNEEGKIQSIGEYGEICILGTGLSRGYVNRKDLTEKAFIPYAGDQNFMMYKTGDTGRWLKDGNIEYKGRKDFQVKIRGLRIELSEIDRVIEFYQEGLNCITVTKQISDSIIYMNAFVKGNKNLDIADLKIYLKERLPAYMIPNNICLLDEIPLTENGKADRKALEKLMVQRNKIVERTFCCAPKTTKSLFNAEDTP